jgi:hypothetical protein
MTRFKVIHNGMSYVTIITDLETNQNNPYIKNRSTSLYVFSVCMVLCFNNRL